MKSDTATPTQHLSPPTTSGGPAGTSSSLGRPGSAGSGSRSPALVSSSSATSFHTAAGTHSSMSRTLVDSSEQRRQKGNFSEDDETLADSIIDSMHSCESEATLHGSSGGGGGDGGGDTDMEDELAYHPEEGGGGDIQGYMDRMRQSGGTPTGGEKEREKERERGRLPAECVVVSKTNNCRVIPFPYVSTQAKNLWKLHARI